MDGWPCLDCGRWNDKATMSCATCGARHPGDRSPDPVEAFPGVTLVRDVREDVVAAALAGRSGHAATPMLEPFFQLHTAPRRSFARRLASAMWPLLVLAVVLFFFAVAGLAR
jgi:hypothetical protein